MSDTGVTIPDVPPLAAVPNVELLEVGEDWLGMTGAFTITAEHLRDVIASQEDPAVRTPIIKLGHVDPRFDGQPGIGRVVHLRTTNNGQTLVGDLVGVPAWLTTPGPDGNIVLSSAYPRRSIEGAFNFATRTGNTWDFVLTGLALLGDAYPAVETLDDIRALYGAEAPTLIPADETEVYATMAPQQVRAAMSLDDVRRQFYEGLDAGQSWWWIREVRVDPLELIVDDDEGGLYRIPVTVSGQEASFGEPDAIRVEYVAASGSSITAALFQSPEEAGRPEPESDDTITAEQQQEVAVELSPEVLKRLGLAEDASIEDVQRAILALPQPDADAEAEADDATPETPADEPPAPANDPDPEPTGPAEGNKTGVSDSPGVPEGMALIDEATLAELREGVAAARQLTAERDRVRRDDLLDGAIRAGKFPISRRGHYEALYASDPEGARQMIGQLAEGIVPITEVGNAGGEDAADVAASYPASWEPRVAAAHRGTHSRVKVVRD